jgi:hypothetical protein
VHRTPASSCRSPWAMPLDVSIPGQKYSFGIVIDAQAAGDLAVLESRGRRALRIHLGKDVQAGFEKIAAAVGSALA